MSDEPILQWNDAWCVEIQARLSRAAVGNRGRVKRGGAEGKEEKNKASDKNLKPYSLDTEAVR